jgi:TolB protein
VRGQNRAARCPRAFERSKIAGLALLAAIAVVMIATPAGAAFPGQNGRIAYYRFFGDPTVLETLRADGSHLKRLPTGRWEAFDPAWSANGNWVAYGAFRSGGRGAIRISRADGSDRATVVKTPVGAFRHVSDPTWSPNGGRLVFCADNAQIFVVGSDGSELTRLSTAGQEDCRPVWSPDGRWLAFDSRQPDDTLALMVMRPDGTGRRTIVDRGGAFSPDWSPDGTHLLFSGTIGSSRTLFSVSADGTERVNLTPTPHADEWLGVFSPNGKKIVYSRSRGRRGLDNLWVMAVDGSNPHPITHTPHIDEFAPSWRPR